MDSHRLHLTSHQELMAPFVAAGFEARIEEAGLMRGRGLLILRR